MILSKHQALLEGSKLWVIPENKYPPWNGRINWLINFQLSKAQIQTDPQMSSWLKNCIQETETEIPKINKSETILIPVKHQLPTDWLCQVPLCNSNNLNGILDVWVQNINKVWNQLQRPKMRVFLPTVISQEDWLRSWLKLEPEEELTVVLQN